MTRAEVSKIIAVLVVSYPNFDKFKSAEQVEVFTNLWTDFFADDPAELVGLAVRRHISTSKWPPSIAEVRELMVEISRPDLVPPFKAWELAKNCASRGDDRQGVPLIVAETVDAIGRHMLRDLSRGENPGMAYNTFLKDYSARLERAKKEAALPEKLRTALPTAERRKLEGR